MSGRYYEESRLYAAIQRLNDAFRPLSEGYRSSRFRRILGRLESGFDYLAALTRQSWLVRWLTAEPEPDVIVIDLTETRTVGPILELLDRLLPYGERAWTGSGTRRVAARTATGFENAPVQVGSALLLGVLLAQLALTWTSASRFSLGMLCLLAAPALLGLRVDWTWDELAESKFGQLAMALLVPPEPPDDGGRK